MSLLFSRAFPTASELILRRSGSLKSPRHVTSNEALSLSVVWASVRLRADLVSTSPVDVYRDVDGRRANVPSPAVLVNPGGAKVDIVEWLYSTQSDLDRFGNTFGLITSRDGLGFPARIDLFSADEVTVLTKDGQITGFRVGGRVYDPADIWHEKQYTVAGCPVGLSPLAHAALTMSTGISAREFAAAWFSGSGVPASHLKNTTQTLDPTEAEKVKARFETSVGTGDVFVTGSDWEYKVLGATASDSSFIEAIGATDQDLTRFLGVPGDMVDVNSQTGSITYANITQRNLQLLIMNLGPAVTRRERALSTLMQRPRYVKLNTDAVVLRMDPMSRAELNATLLESHQRAPSEVREKDDLPPFTPEQIAEIQALAKPTPIGVTAP